MMIDISSFLLRWMFISNLCRDVIEIQTLPQITIPSSSSSSSITAGMHHHHPPPTSSVGGGQHQQHQQHQHDDYLPHSPQHVNDEYISAANTAATTSRSESISISSTTSTFTPTSSTTTTTTILQSQSEQYNQQQPYNHQQQQQQQQSFTTANSNLRSNTNTNTNTNFNILRENYYITNNNYKEEYLREILIYPINSYERLHILDTIRLRLIESIQHRINNDDTIIRNYKVLQQKLMKRQQEEKRKSRIWNQQQLQQLQHQQEQIRIQEITNDNASNSIHSEMNDSVYNNQLFEISQSINNTNNSKNTTTELKMNNTDDNEIDDVDDDTDINSSKNNNSIDIVQVQKAYKHINQLRDYLPQFVSAILKSPSSFFKQQQQQQSTATTANNDNNKNQQILFNNNNDPIKYKLISFITNRCCMYDPNLGILLCWLIEAELGTTWKLLLQYKQEQQQLQENQQQSSTSTGTSRSHPTTQRRLVIIVIPSQLLQILSKLSYTKQITFTLLQQFEQATAYGTSTTTTLSPQYHDDTIQNQNQNNNNNYEQSQHSINDTNTDTDNSDDIDNLLHAFDTNFDSSSTTTTTILPESLRVLRCKYYGDTMQFIDQLTQLSIDLRSVSDTTNHHNQHQRTMFLQQRLYEINRRLRRRMISYGSISLEIDDNDTDTNSNTNYNNNDPTSKWPTIYDITADMIHYSIHLPIIPSSETGVWPTTPTTLPKSSSTTTTPPTTASTTQSHYYHQHNEQHIQQQQPSTPPPPTRTTNVQDRNRQQYNQNAKVKSTTTTPVTPATTSVVRVLNIVVNECRILSSRERCPYMVHVEVADTPGYDGRDVRLYCTGSLSSTTDSTPLSSDIDTNSEQQQQHLFSTIQETLLVQRPHSSTIQQQQQQQEQQRHHHRHSLDMLQTPSQLSNNIDNTQSAKPETIQMNHQQPLQQQIELSNRLFGVTKSIGQQKHHQRNPWGVSSSTYASDNVLSNVLVNEIVADDSELDSLSSTTSYSPSYNMLNPNLSQELDTSPTIHRLAAQRGGGWSDGRSSSLIEPSHHHISYRGVYTSPDTIHHHSYQSSYHGDNLPQQQQQNQQSNQMQYQQQQQQLDHQEEIYLSTKDTSDHDFYENHPAADNHQYDYTDSFNPSYEQDARQYQYEQLHNHMSMSSQPPVMATNDARHGSLLSNLYSGTSSSSNRITYGQDLLDRVFGQEWQEKCIEIRHASPYGNIEGWRLASFIMKAGEDIRRESLVMQIITKLRDWFNEEIPISKRPYLRPYTIMCVGGDAGIVECVNDAKNVDEIKRRTDNFISLRSFFERAYGPAHSSGRRYNNPNNHQHQPNHYHYHKPKSTISFEVAQNNFLRSLVGYSLVCYILQIKDRHNANILLDRVGHILHIDYGYVLGDTPKMGKVPIFSERAPFKLSQDFWDVLGGWNTRDGGLGVKFCEMFEIAFAVASKHADEIASLVESAMLLNVPSVGGLGIGNSNTDDNIPGARSTSSSSSSNDSIRVTAARTCAAGVRSRLRMRGPNNSQKQKLFIMDLVNAALTSWGTTTYDWLQRNMNGYQ